MGVDQPGGGIQMRSSELFVRVGRNLSGQNGVTGQKRFGNQLDSGLGSLQNSKCRF